MTFKKIAACICWALFGMVVLACSGKSKESPKHFRAGVAKVNITPAKSLPLLGYDPRMSTDVRDSLYHRVVVLDDGSTSFYLVTSDICSVDPSIYERVLGKLKSKYGIDRQNFWWSFSHTHSAPVVGPSGTFSVMLGHTSEAPHDQAYVNFVEERLLQAVEQARKSMVAAKLGVGFGESQANINRRARDINNNISLGEYPEGPIDRKIGVLRIERTDNSLLALIGNYPIHGTVLPPSDRTISGDVVGVVSQYVEKKLGATMLFANGAEGNVAPIGSHSGNLEQFKPLLGDKIIEAANQISVTTTDVKLDVGSFILETPRHERLNNWPTYLSSYLGTSSGKAMIKMPISFLFINKNIAIWSAPCELFNEVATAVRDNSPFPFTFFYGVTNGTLGYLPTRSEFALGGYEAGVSPFTPGAAEEIVQKVGEYLNKR